MDNSRQVIYLYDLPKNLATSVKIAEVVSSKANYDLTEEVKFRECRPNKLTGLPSPFCIGIIKID